MPHLPNVLTLLSALIVCVSALPSRSVAQDSSNQPLEEQAVQSAAVTESLRQDVQFLASEELRGRSVTDETINIARDYLRDRMQSIGLKLDAVGGAPFQSVDIPVGSEIRNTENNFFRFQVAGKQPIDVKLGEGFGPLAIGRDQAKASGRVVFAGYGITSTSPAYDDYQSIDANGAVVMILRKEPGASDPDSPFDGVGNTRHAWFATKISNAIKHGAAAVLIVNDSASTREAAQKEQNRIDQERRRKEGLTTALANLPEEATKNRLAMNERIAAVDRMINAMQADLVAARRGVLGVSDAGTKTNQSDKIPVLSIARDLADEILKASSAPGLEGGSGLEALEQKIDQTFKPASRSLDSVSATLSVDLKPAVAISDNVIGLLPGKGPLARETIVVGAHYDHVGMGEYASLAPGTIAVHNGADDNASGTAAMLACAERLTQLLQSTASHRTVLFIAFTGEERGLVGSQHYVENPVWPIEMTTSMINLDMVGRLRDNELTIYGTGSATGLESVVDAANKMYGFQLFKVASGYGPSDHQSFYRVGVPVLFFFTGIHNDYHRPSDDFDKIDFGNLTRVTDMVSEVAFRLAVLPQRPVYAETDPNVQIRHQMTAFMGIRVRQQNGSVVITELTAGGPASKAGMQIGDEIQRIGTTVIRNTNDVLSWVRTHEPGDNFEIKVRRTANLLTLRGKLEKRSD
ncbi:MAG: M28 family peptidase [Planctomycetales bacterium]|nr:M28 family peptidase [Planctomycetales bacterium]